MTTDMVEGEVVEETAVAVIEPHAIEPVRLSSLTPVETIDLASQMASALKDIVKRQRLFTKIGDKDYPHVEAWMTIGRMDNVVAQEESVVMLEGGGFEAIVTLLRLSDGTTVGRGSAWAGTPDDRPWNARSKPVQRSMAVTRATSRAFRQQYGWIMALAGYEPTPAEEMPAEGPRSAPERPPAPRVVSAPTFDPVTAPEPSDEVLQAVVSDPPEDGVRMVQSSHTPKRWEGATEKLEVVTKISNRKHTAILLGELANAALDFGIQVGEAVQFPGGHVEEITWQEGKPTKKEIWGATDVLVMRDGTWTSVRGSSSATVSSTAPSTAPSPTSTSPAQSVPTRRRGPDGTVETTLRVGLTAPIEFKVHPRTNEAVASFIGAEVGSGELIYAALGGDDNVLADLGTPAAPFYEPGDVLQLVGTWQGGWVVLTTVGKPA